MTTQSLSQSVRDEALLARGPRDSVIVRSSFAGVFWLGGWLFCIGFLQLVWWKALLGLLLWPYFLGTSFH